MDRAAVCSKSLCLSGHEDGQSEVQVLVYHSNSSPSGTRNRRRFTEP